MSAVKERVETIRYHTKLMAYGLLEDAVLWRWLDGDIAEAARFYVKTNAQHDESKEWREKVKPEEFDFDGMDWGKDDDDDPFRVDADAAPGKIKNKRG
ncbi:hypothetical protein N5K21_27405 [Rhizobium pusense]|uniref:hypothetical protein n=1 Tax=Agrobacterium pusense TaxID=648995 RepID=UPI00244906F7|nr:hypothetical protein [Agrobacterium pusense]MDH2092450.1 hypothetical protein [Agrobacterium pusense]